MKPLRNTPPFLKPTAFGSGESWSETESRVKAAVRVQPQQNTAGNCWAWTSWGKDLICQTSWQRSGNLVYHTLQGKLRSFFFFSLYGVTFFLCVEVFWGVGFNHTCLFVRVVFLLMFVLKSLNIFCHIWLCMLIESYRWPLDALRVQEMQEYTRLFHMKDLICKARTEVPLLPWRGWQVSFS